MPRHGYPEGDPRNDPQEHQSGVPQEALDACSDHVIFHVVTTGDDTVGWIHTHGLFSEFGLPDLEIRHVPLFLTDPCVDLLHHIAACCISYHLKGFPAEQPGTTIHLGDGLKLNTEDACVSPIADDPATISSHYSTPRLLLNDFPMRNRCQAPGCDCGGHS